jgi:hypothetical protein
MQPELNLTEEPIDPVELASRFETLQQKLLPLWQWIGRSDPGGEAEEANTIVVVPSLSVDVELEIARQQVYEERFLFMLFLLRQPKIRLILVTSVSIPPSIVDYYLDVLPGVIGSSARERLFLVSPQDASQQPLTRKLLHRPRLIRQIRDLIPDLDRAHLVPFNTTDLERELALRIGIPMYAADPRFFCFGTKSGSRRIFAEENVTYPLGAESLFGEQEMVAALIKMRAAKPETARAMVKLNEGVGGMGNAVVDLEGLPPPGDPAEVGALLQRLRSMAFELPQVSYDWYIDRIGKEGGIVEERIAGQEMFSPSAQLRVSPLGEVELLSTHDQMLGGPSGQSYLGARFPADPAYGPLITAEAMKIGQRLARERIIGRFAVDFMAVRSPGADWETYAIEVNLRKGGTTAPFLTLQYLTDGRFDPETGVFLTARGQPKYYVASDHVESKLYRAFTPGDLFEIIGRRRLHFDHTSQTGVVLHMISSVAALGLFGATAIADTPAEADALYNRLVQVMDEEATAALNVSP